jgi:GH24 family phage-related lysozyme (muramidase)
MPIDKKISRTGLEFIKAWEGFRARAAQRRDGVWVIGHGHTERAQPGMEIDRDVAETLLLHDLRPMLDLISAEIHAPLDRRQVDALTSLIFNIGVANFKRSGMIRHLNEGRMLEAAAQFEMWRSARIEGDVMVLDALVRRRAAERAMFLTLPQGVTPAPSRELHIVADPGAASGIPGERPVIVDIAFEGDLAGVLGTRHGLPGEQEGAGDLAVQRLRNILPIPERGDHEAPISANAASASDLEADEAPTTLTEPAEDLVGQRPGDLEIRTGAAAREAESRFGGGFDGATQSWPLEGPVKSLPMPPGGSVTRPFWRRAGPSLFAFLIGLLLLLGALYALSNAEPPLEQVRLIVIASVLITGVLLSGIGLYVAWDEFSSESENEEAEIGPARLFGLI